MLTKRDLKEYEQLKADIRGLNEAIEQTYAEVQTVKYDRVGSSPQGTTSDPTQRKVKAILKMKEKRERLISKFEAIEDKILFIDDCEVSRICYQKYILGKSWEETSKHITGSKHSGTVRYILNNYLDLAEIELNNRSGERKGE